MKPDTMATDEMEQRLRAYADARLSPTPEAVERMRAAIVARAAGGRAMRDGQRRTGAVVGPAWWPIRSRRAIGALLAASLTLGSTAAVFGATPGSPLYGTRLWLELLTLPQSGDARLDAQVAQLDQRDAERSAPVRRDCPARLVADPIAPGRRGPACGIADRRQRRRGLRRNAG